MNRAVSRSPIGLQATRRLVLAVAALALVGCASGPDRPKPAELGPNPALIGVRLAWTAPMGEVRFPLQVPVTGSRVAVADDAGVVRMLDAVSGRILWQANVGEPIAAGVGSDGDTAAVVTRGNTLVTLRDGQVVWRQPLSAQVFTAPLVAGARVFVAAADRTVTAFDGATGRRLWARPRAGTEPLVLRQAGALLAVGNTLVVGVAGRLEGLDPLTGSVRWEAPLATPRGTNDVERLVDIVAGVSREGTTVCARAFQANVGCVDAVRGNLLWAQRANGYQGLAGDGSSVYGVESEGTLRAWDLRTGAERWSQDKLRYRQTTAPAVVGRSVAVGDGTGFVHLLSREDGGLLDRLSTDGSAVAATPVLAADTLVVVTQKGGVYGFRPQ
ncbi:outer membrane protein assembly factor BamB [Tibeticola sp.]|uniref:outer membrane protein assembly factor BamB n=1 Tax=Tibeticola sp. TaxID=2005368 RepID=UPI0025D0B4AA|nr:outer membrane protein assembly factor BamB [Tibeticola sp.]